MSRSAHFRVDPKLTHVLGENYSSSEKALKELVDNAWDAEATEVFITVPTILSDAPIIVRDNGSGMKTAELEAEYLNIASPRFSRKGDRTPNFSRIVKGRKGIGKFAGLILASEMELITQAAGKRTRVLISKTALMEALGDLEKVPLPLDVADSDPLNAKGTTITLSNLNPKLSHLQPDKLKELLALDYGREPTFVIFVNGERVFHHDIQGEKFQTEIALPNGQTANVSYTIADKPLSGKKSGLNVRVGGKSIGKPHLFGLENDDALSDRLRRRIVGEINLPADSLELTAAGGDVIESDKGFEILMQAIPAELKQNLEATHTKEFNLAKARFSKELKRRLENIPEFRREILESRLTVLMQRAFQDGEKTMERIEPLATLVVDALEKDEYWTVCHNIHEAERVDIFHFATALEEFGLCDLAFMGTQAKRRLEFLDSLERLATTEATTEKQMHTALQNNLWVFGPEYSLMASNRQLRTIIEDYIGPDATDRPDLFLAGNVLKQHLLIEFKKPTMNVGRKAEFQATTYADTLTGKLGMPLEIFIIGGEVDPKLVDEYTGKKTKFASYRAVIASAKTQLEWLISELIAS
ncbi:MAG: ATP-binding protein [Akkermansiaceae bacterium]|nr:ATP-binding protein [Akkermansiaceae bacterium]